jgi:sulfate/thiosulfate transport system permease protein
VSEAVSLNIARRVATPASTSESPLVRRMLIGAAVAFLGVFLVVPLAAVFYQAVCVKGLWVYWQSLTDPMARAAIRLTLLAALVAVPINTVFGVAAAWAIAKFEFRGKQLLVTLIDIPFCVSPVISGLIFVLLFGRNSPLGAWLEGQGVRVIFAVPGIVLATLFVTFPFVARELIPLMQAQGSDEEEAARVLGAGGWQTFWRVTLPNIKWALLYGVILCNGRAMGEFGAVSVVSAHIAGRVTMPLYIEILNHNYNLTAAFAVASLLAMLALVTLVLKSILQWRVARQLAEAARTGVGE